MTSPLTSALNPLTTSQPTVQQLHSNNSSDNFSDFETLDKNDHTEQPSEQRQTIPFTGRCLCGAVHYRSSGPAVFMGNCYCIDCRRESGTGHITAVAVPDSTLETTGTTVDFIKPSDSGKTIRNTFCPVCATTLYTHPSGLPNLALIRAGTLEDVSGVVPHINMYVASAPAWDQPPNDVISFPGMMPEAR